MLHIIFNTEQAFRGLKPSWKDLLSRVGDYSPFLTPEWIIPWWEEFGHLGDGTPQLVVTYEGDALVGLLPLYISGTPEQDDDPPKDRLRLMGTTRVCSDHLDGLVDPDHREGVIETWKTAILEILPKVDALDFTDLDKQGTLAQSLPELPSGYKDHTQVTDHCPFIEFPDNYKDYFAARSAKLRGEVRNKTRKVEAEGEVSLRWITKKKEALEGFQAFVDLHQVRRESIGDEGSFSDDTYLAFHQKVVEQQAAAGRLKLGLLCIDDQPVAGRYGFKVGDRYFDYLPGHNPEYHKLSVGLVLLNRITESLIEDGFTEFDFLRGDEDYKLRWTTGAREQISYFAAKKLSGAWLNHKKERALRSVKNAAKKALRKA